MNDFNHLEALYTRLANETIRLDASKTTNERKHRAVGVDGIRREIAGEYAFLGLEQPTPCELSDDELGAELAEFGSPS